MAFGGTMGGLGAAVGREVGRMGRDMRGEQGRTTRMPTRAQRRDGAMPLPPRRQTLLGDTAAIAPPEIDPAPVGSTEPTSEDELGRRRRLGRGKTILSRGLGDVGEPLIFRPTLGG